MCNFLWSHPDHISNSNWAVSHRLRSATAAHYRPSARTSLGRPWLVTCIYVLYTCIIDIYICIIIYIIIDIYYYTYIQLYIYILIYQSMCVYVYVIIYVSWYTSWCNPLGGNGQGKLKVFLVPSWNFQVYPAMSSIVWHHDGWYYPNLGLSQISYPQIPQP